MKVDDDKHKKEKQKALKKPRDLTVNFLREIPGPEGKGISLKKLVNEDSQKEASYREIITFLELFGVILITNEKSDQLIKAVSRSAADFIASLTIFIENSYSLTSNWDKPRDPANSENEEFLDRGVNLLSAIEERRSNLFGNNSSLQDVNINLYIIKADVKGTPDHQYLMEYNSKTHMYQLIGGYLEGTDPESESAYNRLAEKDLPLNNFDPKKDFTLKRVTEPISTTHISSKWGVNTKYNVNLTQVTISRGQLKLNGKEKWFTLDEILDGKTSDGISIKSPFDDVEGHERDALIALFRSLPTSLTKVQPEAKHDLVKALGKLTDSVRITEIVKQDESVSLEFKSSARWDYNKNIVNKDLEKSIVKTIAGFLNSSGGTLVIGMDDKKRILGIDNDCKTLSKNSQDGYEQFIIALMTSYLGVEFGSFVKISFENYNEKTLCVVDVAEAPYPVFVKEKEDREFYIRAANSTRELNAEEVYKYIQINW